MKTLLGITALLILAYVKTHAAESAGPTLGFEPYGIVSWTGINGAAEMGAGANVTAAITKNLTAVGFGEADDVTGTFVDRFGGGLRYTAWLGQRFSLGALVGLGYDVTDPHVFARLAPEANAYIYRSKNASLGGRVAYAVDVDGDGKHGTATGRFFFGLVGNYSF